MTISIIKAIAAGNHKLSTIAAVLEVKSTNLTKYLKTLMDLDILERRVPVTEENPEKSKRGLYKIKDNYLRFRTITRKTKTISPILWASAPPL